MYCPKKRLTWTPEKAKPKTKRHFKVRMCDYFGISSIAEKPVEGNGNATNNEHLLFCDYITNFDDFSILATNITEVKIT